MLDRGQLKKIMDRLGKKKSGAKVGEANAKSKAN